MCFGGVQPNPAARSARGMLGSILGPDWSHLGDSIGGFSGSHWCHLEAFTELRRATIQPPPFRVTSWTAHGLHWGRHGAVLEGSALKQDELNASSHRPMSIPQVVVQHALCSGLCGFRRAPDDVDGNAAHKSIKKLIWQFVSSQPRPLRFIKS